MPPPAGLRHHVALRRCQVNASAAGVDFDRAIDIAQIDAAAAGDTLMRRCNAGSSILPPPVSMLAPWPPLESRCCLHLSLRLAYVGAAHLDRTAASVAGPCRR